MRDQIIGRVINLRDITERKMAEEALKQKNQKLLLLSGITRHDILNQITALKLYLSLLTEEYELEERGIVQNKMNHLLEVMELHITFTSDYQDVGLHEPVWYNVKQVFLNASKSFSSQNITFSVSGDTWEVYSDPLLERVFYNLIDNSIRHGTHVSSILLTTVHKNDELIIYYKDDGTGVHPKDKEKIFMKGFGKHTGFGMFLIDEILSITGISIQERGTYGKGVIFEIHVPPARFRPYLQ